MSLKREGSGERRGGYSSGLVWLLLAGSVAAVYYGVTQHAFVNFDDPMYLYENSRVTAGFTMAGLRGAWTSMDTLQWQPLTWMVHMGVSEFGGMAPGVHLGVNVLLHALNAGLLFLFLRTVTGAAGRSVTVALWFAVHPVNVEVVAWASQLKSTLSTACALVGLLVYVREKQRGGGFSFTALSCLGLSLLAKPMMVSFPLLLLLLDYWPLRRMPDSRGPGTGADWGRLLAEKLPFLLLAGAVALVTARPLGSPSETAALNHLEWARVAAVPWNYAIYLRMLFFPADLAVLYPSRLDYPLLAEVGALVVLMGISVMFWRRRERRPELLFGWGWFVLTALPVSGLLRIGPHDLADRYLYVPGIGVLVAVVWLGADLLQSHAPRLSRTVTVVLALALALGASRQVEYWTDSVALWRRAADVTPPSSTRHINLGNALHGAGLVTEAKEEFDAAIRCEPGNPRPYVNLAVIAQEEGDHATAILLLRQALARAPADARILSNLGSLLDDLARPEEARGLLEQAVRLNPGLPEAWVNLGVLHAKAGEWGPASACFTTALELRPGHPQAVQNLALLRRNIERGRTSVETRLP